VCMRVRMCACICLLAFCECIVCVFEFFVCIVCVQSKGHKFDLQIHYIVVFNSKNFTWMSTVYEELVSTGKPAHPVVTSMGTWCLLGRHSLSPFLT